MVHSPNASLTQEIAALRKGVRRVVMVLAAIPAKGATKVASRRAIEGMTKTARGSFQMKRDFETAYRLAARLRDARAEKRKARAAMRVEADRRQGFHTMRTSPGSATSPFARRAFAVNLEKPLVARLHARRISAVESAAKSTFRYGAAGGTSFAIHLVEPGQPVDYDIQLTQNWDTYSRRCRYPALEDHHLIVVERNWRSMTHRIGGPVIDRCMILAIKPVVVTQDGTGVFAATVAVQAAGYAVRTEDRFVTYWGHGISSLHKTYERAIREKPPARLMAIVRAEAEERERERELANLDPEDLAALQDAFAA